MPYHSKETNTEANKGKPTENEHSKASVKETNSHNQKESEKVSRKYTDKNGAPDPDKVNVTNKNRNTDKPDIDKPAYGSSK